MLLVDKGWPLYPDEIGRNTGGFMTKLNRDTIRNYNFLANSCNDEYAEEVTEIKSTGLKIVRLPNEEFLEENTLYAVIEDDGEFRKHLGIFSTREKACVARGKRVKMLAEMLAPDDISPEDMYEFMTDLGENFFVKPVILDKF